MFAEHMHQVRECTPVYHPALPKSQLVPNFTNSLFNSSHINKLIVGCMLPSSSIQTSSQLTSNQLWQECKAAKHQCWRRLGLTLTTWQQSTDICTSSQLILETRKTEKAGKEQVLFTLIRDKLKVHIPRIEASEKESVVASYLIPILGILLLVAVFLIIVCLYKRLKVALFFAISFSSLDVENYVAIGKLTSE